MTDLDSWDISELLQKIGMRHINDFDPIELAILHAAMDDLKGKKYVPLGSLALDLREWLKK